MEPGGLHVDQVRRFLFENVLVEALIEEAGRVGGQGVHAEGVATLALEAIIVGEDWRVGDMDAPEELGHVFDDRVLRVDDVAHCAHFGSLLEIRPGVEQEDATTNAQRVVAQEELRDVRDVECAARAEEGKGDLEQAIALECLALPLEALVELCHDAFVDTPLLRQLAEQMLPLGHEATGPAQVLRLRHVLPLALEGPGRPASCATRN